MQTIVFYGLLASLALQWPPLRQRRWLVVGATVLVIALVGYTRVYLGNHWPTDVLGGWLLGWAWLGGLGTIGRWLATAPASDARLPDRSR